MPILQNGVFSFTIPADDLGKGLRPSRRSPRNVKFLTKCNGAVGLDNVLQVLAELDADQIDTSTDITDNFPYPQIFVFINHIIVCAEDEIFELVGGALVSRLAGLTAGTIWSAVDFHDFIYMSNGMICVVRSPTSGLWSTTTDYPIASSICNFNGQVIIGAPGVEWI